MDSPALLELNTYFKQFVEKFKTRVISFDETIPTRHLGLDLTFVPPESSNPGVGEFLTVPYNHMDICKPESRKSILFRKFYNLLWDCVDDAMPFVQWNNDNPNQVITSIAAILFFACNILQYPVIYVTIP